MEQVILKLLSIFNKPLHFLIVGIFVVIWGIFADKNKNIVFCGMILVMISISSFIDNYCKNQQEKKILAKKEKQKIEQIENEKQKFINLYENLPDVEHYILTQCAENKCPVYQGDYSDEDAIISLCALDLGISRNSDELFVMKQEYLDWLLEYFNNKNGGDKNGKK